MYFQIDLTAFQLKNPHCFDANKYSTEDALLEDCKRPGSIYINGISPSIPANASLAQLRSWLETTLSAEPETVDKLLKHYNQTDGGMIIHVIHNKLMQQRLLIREKQQWGNITYANRKIYLTYELSDVGLEQLPPSGRLHHAIAKKAYKLPGTVRWQYELTDTGFQLIALKASNSHFTELLLADESSFLNEELVKAMQEEELENQYYFPRMNQFLERVRNDPFMNGPMSKPERETTSEEALEMRSFAKRPEGILQEEKAFYPFKQALIAIQNVFAIIQNLDIKNYPFSYTQVALLEFQLQAFIKARDTILQHLKIPGAEENALALTKHLLWQVNFTNKDCFKIGKIAEKIHHPLLAHLRSSLTLAKAEQCQSIRNLDTAIQKLIHQSQRIHQQAFVPLFSHLQALKKELIVETALQLGQGVSENAIKRNAVGRITRATATLANQLSQRIEEAQTIKKAHSAKLIKEQEIQKIHGKAMQDVNRYKKAVHHTPLVDKIKNTALEVAKTALPFVLSKIESLIGTITGTAYSLQNRHHFFSHSSLATKKPQTMNPQLDSAIEATEKSATNFLSR